MDNKNYIYSLCEYVTSLQYSGKAMIVGGPKDQGKSRGLMYFMVAVKRKRYRLLEVNLKGVAVEVDVRKTLKSLAEQVIHNL